MSHWFTYRLYCTLNVSQNPISLLLQTIFIGKLSWSRKKSYGYYCTGILKVRIMLACLSKNIVSFHVFKSIFTSFKSMHSFPHMDFDHFLLHLCLCIFAMSIFVNGLFSSIIFSHMCVCVCTILYIYNLFLSL